MASSAAVPHPFPRDGPSHSGHLGALGALGDCRLTLDLDLEALLQLSIMKPKYNGEMLSAILHGTLEAVLGGPQKEEDREELKRRFRLLLGSLLMEAPSPGTLLQLLSDLRGYALDETGEAQRLVASSISLLLAVARRFPQLRMTVIRPDLACFRRRPKEGEEISRAKGGLYKYKEQRGEQKCKETLDGTEKTALRLLGEYEMEEERQNPRYMDTIPKILLKEPAGSIWISQLAKEAPIQSGFRCII
ncbi:Hypothetical predicted protein [Podarcis lilfordi]|uniref:Uncharacterized protein n=1 Tax=Podarcis lilfordi TaxID=74358 RepID=A0AA35KDD3_9SAUR|nr:Hypothetical predicted protein [Podarcis lilfordi]